MLKKNDKLQDNILNCVNLILKGAKKRRSLAIVAVQSMNNDFGFAPNISVVK